jgi:hypothetical protein
MQAPRDAPAAVSTSPLGDAWETDNARKPVHSTLRLQPVLLGPPPDPNRINVSPEDDIDPAEFGTRSWVGKLAAAAAVAFVLGTAGLAYYVYVGRDAASLESTIAPPAVPIATKPELPRADAPVATSPPVAAITPELVRTEASRLDMGAVQTDLVPPVTDGLNPPKRVQATRIRVENDREITVRP